MILPQGTTWLDLVTLAIAFAGFVVAVVSLVLGIRTDRRESRTAVRIQVMVSAGVLLLRVTNVAQRRVTAERTGFAGSKRDDRSVSFIGWDEVRSRVSAGRIVGDAAFPVTLEPGEPTYEARAPLHVVKTALFPNVPTLAWCEDERGNAYWTRVPDVVQAAVRSAKRRVPGPDDDYGHATYIEIDDDDLRGNAN